MSSSMYYLEQEEKKVYPFQIELNSMKRTKDYNTSTPENLLWL